MFKGLLKPPSVAKYVDVEEKFIKKSEDFDDKIWYVNGGELVGVSFSSGIFILCYYLAIKLVKIATWKTYNWKHYRGILWTMVHFISYEAPLQ